MNFELKGQVVLVSGASRGIGAAIAIRLARAGAKVIVNYKSNKEAAERILEEIRTVSPDSMMSQFDISLAEEVDQAVENLLKRYEKITTLVCNAGISRDQLIMRATPEHFKEVLETNLLGTINLVRSVSRGMMKNRFGRIICMSSVVGQMGNKGQSAYSASKSALFGFAKSVALELGSRHVTCNVVCPGFIETEMTQKLAAEVREAYLGRIPLEKFGTAEDVASCVHFLASDEASYITGAVLDVNGGLVMR